MAILDPQGRLFGRISILDLGAVLIIILVVIGISFVPGRGGSVAQIGGVSTQPVEVDLVFRSVITSDPQGFLETLQNEPTTSIIVRNQPSGDVKLLRVEETPRTTIVTYPDGRVDFAPDPRPELAYSLDLLVTIGGDAQISDTGTVLGGSKLKIGATVELEGENYTMTGKVANVRILTE